MSAMEQSHPPARAQPALGNPLHAGLQLLTDMLSRIPGPHQGRISSKTPADSDSVARQTTASLPPFTAAQHQAQNAWHTMERTTGHGATGAAVASAAESSAAGGSVSREELGRATWTLLHTLAAQYPERPTRQQRKDAKQLVGDRQMFFLVMAYRRRRAVD